MARETYPRTPVPRPVPIHSTGESHPTRAGCGPPRPRSGALGPLRLRYGDRDQDAPLPRPAAGPGRADVHQGRGAGRSRQAQSQLRRETKRVRADKPVGDGIDTDITMTLRDLYLARSELTGADRRAANEMLSRNRVYTDGEVDPITVNTPSSQCSANFCVHYRKAPLSESATATQVQTTLNTLEHVRTFETQTLGYRAPISDAPAVPTTDNPNGKFDVFLGDIYQEGLYGYCAPDGAEPNTEDGRAPAFCVLDNDYKQSQYGIPPINSLRVTAAHEFFHAHPVRLRRRRGHLVHGGLGDLGRGRGLRLDQRQLPVPLRQPDPLPPSIRRLQRRLRALRLLRVLQVRRGTAGQPQCHPPVLGLRRRPARTGSRSRRSAP